MLLCFTTNLRHDKHETVDKYTMTRISRQLRYKNYMKKIVTKKFLGNVTGRQRAMTRKFKGKMTAKEKEGKPHCTEKRKSF